MQESHRLLMRLFELTPAPRRVGVSPLAARPLESVRETWEWREGSTCCLLDVFWDSLNQYFIFCSFCCTHYVQETGLDVRGDIKVRNTAVAHKELTQRDKTFTQGTKAKSIHGATQFSTRILTWEGILVPPLSSMTLGKVTSPFRACFLICKIKVTGYLWGVNDSQERVGSILLSE